MNRLSSHTICVSLCCVLIACSDDDNRGQAATGGGAAVSGFGGSGGFAAVGGGGSSGSGGFAAVGGSGGGGFGGNCATGNANAARVRPTVMLVVDGSRSMEDDYGNGNDSRWSALTTALTDDQIGIVPQLHTVVSFGLAVFSTGNGSADMCPFPVPRIAPTIDNAQAITAALSDDDPPGTYTPTGPALQQVFESLPDASQVLDQDLGPQIVVLATDGEPNSCNSTDRSFEGAIAAAEAGRARGIDMYVVSLADASGDFAAHLQEMANIGAGLDRNATPGATLYVPTNPTELSAALQSIIGGVVGCDIVLDGNVAEGFECAGEATLNSEPLVCNDPNGWTLVDSSHVRLLGTACDRFKADFATQFRVAFPCNGFVPD